MGLDRARGVAWRRGGGEGPDPLTTPVSEPVNDVDACDYDELRDSKSLKKKRQKKTRFSSQPTRRANYRLSNIYYAR